MDVDRPGLGIWLGRRSDPDRIDACETSTRCLPGWVCWVITSATTPLPRSPPDALGPLSPLQRVALGPPSGLASGLAGRLQVLSERPACSCSTAPTTAVGRSAAHSDRECLSLPALLGSFGLSEGKDARGVSTRFLRPRPCYLTRRGTNARPRRRFWSPGACCGAGAPGL